MSKELLFIENIKTVIQTYFTHGARSSKKVDILHAYFVEELKQLIVDKPEYTIKCELDVPSINSSGKKKCDIVLLKNNAPYIIFPVKFCITNYFQNKNNYWEQLTGEICHMKWSMPNLHIIPINILLNLTPYLESSGVIKKFETITYENSLKIYESLKEQKLVYANYNFIVNVSHNNQVNEKYTKMPNIKGVCDSTPFKPMQQLVGELI